MGESYAAQFLVEGLVIDARPRAGGGREVEDGQRLGRPFGRDVDDRAFVVVVDELARLRLDAGLLVLVLLFFVVGLLLESGLTFLTVAGVVAGAQQVCPKVGWCRVGLICCCAESLHEIALGVTVALERLLL